MFFCAGAKNTVRNCRVSVRRYSGTGAATQLESAMDRARHKVPLHEVKSLPSHRGAIANAINKLRHENRRLKELVVELSRIIARKAAGRK